MDRRRFLASSSLAFVAAAFGDQPVLAIGQAAPTPRFEDLRGGVGIFTDRGGTIGWLATPDGVVVVDSQFAETATDCIDGLKEKSPHAIDLLVNTHHHADHTGGNRTFRPLVTSIVAHANSAAWQKKAAVEAKTEADQAYPDTTFTDTWRTTVGSETVTATHYGAGHTSGDVVVAFERANIVHVGDLVFHRMHPFVDRAAGGSFASWIKALDAIPAQHAADTMYIFGHARDGSGVTGRKDDLARFRDYLTAVLDYTSKAIQAGRPRNDIVRTRGLRGFDEYASTPPRMTLGSVLGAAYDELAAR